ncbi:hypothetical protein NPIL_319231 [Nephila pilipes]|uniref:Uncharacterized protein n=1 Tax=Nephila pilipes TaxID=299642 RepID=A0A8X6MMT8_NEPPI|nr:hypothetical protein NPIL_319231 [Nephila pilipes]
MFNNGVRLPAAKTVHGIVTDEWKMYKICAKLVLKVLTPDHKDIRAAIQRKCWIVSQVTQAFSKESLSYPKFGCFYTMLRFNDRVPPNGTSQTHLYQRILR